MRKRVLIGSLVLLIFIVFFVSFMSITLADTTTTVNTSLSSDSKDNGYACLNGIANRTDISLQDAVFATLAIGSKSNIRDKLNSEKSSDWCWPKAGCTLKDTAQVALAYQRLGLDTSGIASWLISKNATLTDLAWYLEIDITNHVKASCTIKYDNIVKTINIKDDMTLSGDPGSCFSISSSGYWLRVKDSCISKDFDVSCNQDFITTLLYQKNNNADTVYVSSKTQSSSASGTLTERVNARCFKTKSTCDYEGSLWTAYALEQLGKDVSPFMPYLIALANDNPTYFPSALIYATAGGDDQYSSILEEQQQSKFWDITGSKYGKFYDTSLALLALSGTAATEFDNAKNYLMDIQQKDGCWNNDNIRDTSFILYSLWKTPVSTAIDSGSTTQLCEPTGHCVARFACQDASGTVLSADYQCTSVGDVCCSVDAVAQTCSQKSGYICTTDQECPLGRSTPSISSGTCCLDQCQAKQQQIVNTCESSTGPTNGACKTECLSTEDPNPDYTCDQFSVCCVPKTQPKSSVWIWVVILIILIILVALAIIFRDRLKLSWFKFKGKASSSTIKRPTTPPSAPPQARPVQQRPIFGMRPAQPSQPPRRVVSSKDKEMEETLRKLKEISK